MTQSSLWTMQPTYVRVYLLCVYLVTALASVKFFTVLWNLYRRSFRKVGAERLIHAEGSLVQCALRNGVEPASITTSSPTEMKDYSSGRLPQSVRTAEEQFRCALELLWSDAKLVLHLGTLTLWVSFFVVAYGAAPTVQETYNNAQITGYTAIVISIGQLLSRLAVGLFSYVVLYAEWLSLDYVLVRRKASWFLIIESLRRLC